MKIAVILSGCGVYDGAEIHESVAVLYHIDRLGHTAVLFAPDAPQHHVVNHLNGEPMSETRNMLVEAARIARGQIRALNTFQAEEVEALILPGGFGAAKNLTDWAFNGPAGTIQTDTAKAIRSMVEAHKPVAALCMAPVVLAKALEETNLHPTLSVGHAHQASPYPIADIHQGIQQTGAFTENVGVPDVFVDTKNKLVTAPCYMMEATISQVFQNAEKALRALISLV
jgi:enhancing lycopene biosynthesis protein 2